MDDVPVVTCFLRHDGRVLLLRRSDAVGSSQGKWGGVAGHVAASEIDPRTPERDPIEAAREEIQEETDIEDATLIRRGDSFAVEDDDRGTRWRVHPFLFHVDDAWIETDAETTAFEWVHAPAIRRRETVHDLWTSYDRVRPRVATVREDTTHGAAYLSIRALEVLRDEAALAAADCDPDEGERGGNDWDGLSSLANELLAARPSMAVVANRVDRAMTGAAEERIAEATEEARPGVVERAATQGIERAVRVGTEAATSAAAELPDHVATLSRSGTVRRALLAAEPETVLVAESRPGGEGVNVADSLARDLGRGSGTAVTLTTDAALAFELDERDVDAVVVGADRILPDGSVVNKVGTRAAALAAPSDCDVLVVASTDKVATDESVDREERDAAELYDGDGALDVANPTFDVTPAAAIDAIVTEDGVLSPAEIPAIAENHRERSDW